MRYTILAAIMLFLIFSVISCGGETPNSTSETAAPLEKVIPAEAAAAPQPAPDREVQAVGPVPPLLTQALTGDDEITLYWDSILPGDYNVDGTVNGMDVFPLAVHFGEDVAGSPGNECIDGNGDTTLNGLDLFTIAVGFDNRIDGVYCYVDDNPGGDFTDPPLNDPYVAYQGCWAQQEYAWTIPDHNPTYFAVRSFDENAVEFSELSEIVWPDEPPSIPQSLVGTPGPCCVVLEWDEVSEIDLATYEVGRAAAFGGPYTIISTEQFTVPGFNADGLEGDGNSYVYAVRAVDIYDATSGWSNEIEAAALPLPVCEGLTWRGGAGDSDFDLGWLPDDSGTWKGWVVETRYPAGDWQQWYTNVPVNEGDPDYGLVISKIWGDEGQLRDYRVAGRATDDSMGPWTELLQVGPSDMPAPPEGITVINQDTVSSIYFQPSSSEDRYGYNIYWSETPGGPYERRHTPKPFENIPPTITNSGSNQQLYQAGGLTNETDYYFVITTVDDMRTESVFSAEIQAHPSEAPPVPTDLTVEHMRYVPWARITWDGEQPPDWYLWRVWRSTSATGPYQVVSTQTGNEYIDEMIDWGEEYYYFVSSIDEWGVQSDKTAGELFAPGPDRWEFHTIGSGSAVSQYHSITHDGNDNPVVAFYDNNVFWLNAASYNGVDWDIEQVDLMTEAAHPSIAYGPNSGLGIAYRQGGDFPRIKYAWNYGSGWFNDTILTGGDYGYRCSLAFYNGNLPAVAFIDDDQSDLRYAQWDASSWNNQLVYDAYNEGLGLDFDSLNRPTIGFYRSYLHASKKVAGNWITEQISDAVQPWYVDAALDPNDIGIFTFHNPDSQRMEAYWNNGADWESHVIDERTSTGWYGSVAFDGNGMPAVAYKGAAPSSNWTFAWWDGGAWRRFERADDPTTWTDIAFNTDDEPAISYYAGDYSELRVAVCNVPE